MQNQSELINKLIFCAGLFFIVLLSAQALAKGDDVVAIPEYSRVYDPARDPFQDGRDALALARTTDRLVMIEVGGDWCVWCHVLDAFIKENKTVYDTLYTNYVVLKVNVSDENDNKEFLSGLPKSSGYPHLFITTNDGAVIYSTDTTRLLMDGEYVPDRVITFLEHWLDKKSTQEQAANDVAY